MKSKNSQWWSMNAWRSRSSFYSMIAIPSLAVLAAACGKGGGDNNCNDGNCGGGGGGAALAPKMDISGAVGLLVVDPSKSGGSRLAREHNEQISRLGLVGAARIPEDHGHGLLASAASGGGSSSSDDGAGSLQKTDSSGNVSNVVSVPSQSGNMGHHQKLPKIQTIAVSTKKELFIHFEHPFRHRALSSQGGGDWSDGDHCQVFRVKGGNVDTLKASAPGSDNLECLSYNHFIDNWQAARQSVFQFDSAGNVYFPGRLANGSNTVVYKFDRATSALSEMINANICVQDFMVTKSGGMFYTGTSSCQGGGGGNGGFFRYVSGAGGSLTEIARNWWNFIYEPVSTATTDKAVFFGPDPRSATTASWSSACIFNFDPAGGSTLADRTSNVITCGSDIWSWIQMTRTEDITAGYRDTNNKTYDWQGELSTAGKAEYKTRCESSGQVFAGGGSQISAIKQDSNGQVYIIGNVRKKNAGTLSCNVEVRGGHCKISGNPTLVKSSTTLNTSSNCTSVGGTWVDDGWCNGDSTKTTELTCVPNASSTNIWSRNSSWYNNVESDICVGTSSDGLVASSDWWSSDQSKSFQNVTGAAPSTTSDPRGYVAEAGKKHFRVNSLNCAQPSSSGGGDGWTSEYQGMAKVDATTKTLTLLSGVTEQAIRLWLVNDEVYYSAFSTVNGHYQLRKYNGSGSDLVVDNFEAYNLSSTGDSGSMYYDGLDFANNSYSFGTIATSSPFTRSAKVGLTGTLKTIVILPKN